MSASLGQTPSSGDGHGPSWPTLQGKLSYIAVLAAVMTIAPACIPFLASGGGGGSKFYHGFGGDGGGGFFNSLVPLAHAGAHPCAFARSLRWSDGSSDQHAEVFTS